MLAQVSFYLGIPYCKILYKTFIVFQIKVLKSKKTFVIYSIKIFMRNNALLFLNNIDKLTCIFS